MTGPEHYREAEQFMKRAKDPVMADMGYR